jgi:hypothetical protein
MSMILPQGRHFSWHVARAEHYKALEQTRIYLDTYENQLDVQPWDFVESIGDGCFWCNDMPTGVQFTAKHHCGLEFSWSLDIQDRSERGMSEVLNRKRVMAIVNLLPSKPRAEFLAWLKSRAEKVRALAAKNQTWMSNMADTARFLENVDQA